jgi:periplasmic divalent cation tolerance protein
MGGDATEFLIMLCTAPPDGGEGIARALVEERLAACVNVTQVRSHFIWEGGLCREHEELLIIKTETRLAGKVKERIKELHSYQVPEILMLPIAGGDDRYLRWMRETMASVP